MHFITRDNTLIEMGLFWGRLGRRWVFCIIPSVVPVGEEGMPLSFHLRSDLEVLTLLRYIADHSRGPENAVFTACGKILTSVKNEGLYKQRHEVHDERESLVKRKDSIIQIFFE